MPQQFLERGDEAVKELWDRLGVPEASRKAGSESLAHAALEALELTLRSPSSSGVNQFQEEFSKEELQALTIYMAVSLGLMREDKAHDEMRRLGFAIEGEHGGHYEETDQARFSVMIEKFTDMIRTSEFWHKYYAEELMINIMEKDTYREFFAEFNIGQEQAQQIAERLPKKWLEEGEEAAQKMLDQFDIPREGRKTGMNALKKAALKALDRVVE